MFVVTDAVRGKKLAVNDKLLSHNSTLTLLQKKKKKRKKKNDQSMGSRQKLLFEPVHDNIYSKTCVTSKDSDKPAHQSPGYPKRDEREPCHTGWMYRLIWVFAGHASLTVDVVVRWLICFSWVIPCTNWYKVLLDFPKEGNKEPNIKQ